MTPYLVGALVGFALLCKVATARDLAKLVREIKALHDQRQVMRQLVADYRKRAAIKARIVHIGQAWRHDDGSLVLAGWQFDCSNGALARDFTPGQPLRFYGYTAAELSEIYVRRAEFAPLDAE